MEAKEAKKLAEKSAKARKDSELDRVLKAIKLEAEKGQYEVKLAFQLFAKTKSELDKLGYHMYTQFIPNTTTTIYWT